ncbi:uncharacterized protein A1O5_02155 [Cladophialophora psammophila CBS 110553]|uniref:Short chain oxidoreductase n=1 Tax=Cladophialophora psammophila CBS 110553 TaxID=1182543 RepID=W9XYX4_9EURO|nr:uncharacterized protein A1O5_02155 [Cladophialophora psammophila CBS 110553]EXJ75459.1 hypothetical protein A1O5_02155 [Cladophialophora psammophila CBS 110553]
MSSYFITGAGRGLGLELVNQLSRMPSNQVSIVIAASRSQPTAALQEVVDRSHGRVIPITVTITDRSSIDMAVREVSSRLEGKGLDVLINNAGVMPGAFKGIAKMDNLRYAFEVNVEAVHETTAALLPLLKKGAGKQVVNISTTVGSISQAEGFAQAPFPAYKVSKAALNMLTVQYALEYGKEGFTFYVISPGWLKTDMGSQNADLGVDVGAGAVLDIVLNSRPEYNGTFRNILVPGWENNEGPNRYDGKEVPW